MEAHLDVLGILGLAASLSEQSKATYSTAFSTWLRFCAICQLDPFTTVKDASLEDLCRLTERFIALECGARQIAPQTIFRSYLPGIAYVFDMILPGNHFRAATLSPRCKFMLAGFTKLYAKVHPEGRKVKIPFTLDLICFTYDRLRSSAVSDHDRLQAYRMFLALSFGFMFLLRRSEYLSQPSRAKGTAVPFTRSLICFYKGNARISYKNVGLASWKATRVFVAIPFSKTDCVGHARVLSHDRCSFALDHSEGVCIVSHLEAWVSLTRDRYQTPEASLLFDCPPLPRLTSASVDSQMKSTALAKGLPRDKVSSHSLRYGGATTLASVGAPQYLISFYGGWSDGSINIYTRPTGPALAFATEALSRRRPALTDDIVIGHIIRSEINHK